MDDSLSRIFICTGIHSINISNLRLLYLQINWDTILSYLETLIRNVGPFLSLTLVKILYEKILNLIAIQENLPSVLILLDHPFKRKTCAMWNMKKVKHMDLINTGTFSYYSKFKKIMV